ncbi:MAG: glutamyl-tRNA reductase [Flavobacteriaceae bacterium]
MPEPTSHKPRSFYAIGLSYKKADAVLRGKFSLDAISVEKLLNQAKTSGIEALFAISTCNRTELYGFAEHPFQLIQLLCNNTQGSLEAFQKVAYVHKGKEAVSHLFHVGTGIDSQILGDFEIIGQLKKGFALSKSLGLTNPFLERLCNSVIQASKRIKTETCISTGATSVAFASVQYILNHVMDVDRKHILLFGMGKIGRNTCENLVKHIDGPKITLINRTKDRAEKMAGKFNVEVRDYGELQAEIRKADVLIVATGAKTPTITEALVHTKKPLLILDLSIPKNVDASVGTVRGVKLVHLDELSQITDATLEERKKHLPQAHAIIGEIKGDFNEWLEMRKFAPVIKALKTKLKTMKDEELDNQSKKLNGFEPEHVDVVTNRIIHKITSRFANYLKESDIDTEESLALIQKIFQLEVNRA